MRWTTAAARRLQDTCILATEIGEQIAGVRSASEASRVVCCLQCCARIGEQTITISETTSSSCGCATELFAAPEIHRSSTISNSFKSSIGSHSVPGTLDCTWRYTRDYLRELSIKSIDTAVKCRRRSPLSQPSVKIPVLIFRFVRFWTSTTFNRQAAPVDMAFTSRHDLTLVRATRQIRGILKCKLKSKSHIFSVLGKTYLGYFSKYYSYESKEAWLDVNHALYHEKEKLCEWPCGSCG